MKSMEETLMESLGFEKSVGMLRENGSEHFEGISDGITEGILGAIPKGIPFLNPRRNS